MPTRDYQCRTCKYEFEALDKGAPQQQCQKCVGRLDVVFKQTPAYHKLFSFMHPRKHEGRVKG